MASEKEEPAVSVSPSLSDQGVPSPTMKIDEAVPMVSDEEDSKLSKRITRKCDLRLVPMLASLYLVAFLDRANIANARLLGFEKDLNMPSNGYNTAIWIFFLSFVLLEVPSNLLLGWSKIPPHLWLGGMCILLGIVTMCQGFTASAGGLYACRFIMGIFEGALAPAAALLMGQYYRRKEFALRYATFVCFALLGSAFSSFLAYAISFLEGYNGIRAWRWVFIIEGCFSIFVSGFAFWIVPGFPAEAKFLTDEERNYLLARLELERGKEKLTMRNIPWIKVLTNWKIWVNTLCYFCADMSASAIASFSPTVLNQLGWTSTEANVHNIPIWLVSAFICLLSSLLTGKTSRRWPFVITGACLCTVGWVIQLLQVEPGGVRYFALFMIATGAFIQMPILVAWLNNNLTDRPSKAVGAAIQLGFGNSCNFVSSNVFISGEAPKYPTAYKTGLVLTVIGGFSVVGYALLLHWENRRMDKEEEETGVSINRDGIRFRNQI